MNRFLEIKSIDTSHSHELSDLLRSEKKGYSKYFVPFNFDYETINSVLINSINDKYFGLFVNNKLAGFYMLRGIDKGFTIPSYGVFISSDYSGLGLAKLTIHHAFSVCKINGFKEMMLKVHPDNIYAKKMYENFGFKLVGKDEKIGNLIYKITISKKKNK